MRRFLAALMPLILSGVAHAAEPRPERVQLLCHRTANKDVPENTLESPIQAGPSVLPVMGEALGSPNAAIKARAIRIVAWQEDLGSVERLRSTEKTNPTDVELANLTIENNRNASPKIVMTMPSGYHEIALKPGEKEYAACRDDYDRF
jgi:hypothetical protein